MAAFQRSRAADPPRAQIPVGGRDTGHHTGADFILASLRGNTIRGGGLGEYSAGGLDHGETVARRKSGVVLSGGL